MSDSWDEKYDRNKDKAKEAFEDNAQQRGPSFSNDMEAALDGLRDRRRGPEDRRLRNEHQKAHKPDDRSVLDVLRGVEAKSQNQQSQEELDGPPDRERPAPRPPELALGGSGRKMEPPPPSVERANTEQERMRALLRAEREREKERERDKDPSR